ncbi:MAG: MaoC family dehydratase [Acidobacteria bacterium]|nr:MaoC family dehydratase [Acidobacteriota bacterium]
MLNAIYTLENLAAFIGKEIGVSDWMQLSQQRINDFAEVTEDRQWIHVDTDRAKDSPFGAPIAHGLLLISLTTKLSIDAGAMPTDASMCINYGFDKIRFRAPVKVGQHIRCRATLLNAKKIGSGRYLLTTRYTIEIKGISKPACIADGLGLFYQRV